MKRQVIRFSNDKDEAISKAAGIIHGLPSGHYEVTISDASKTKTLAQLGGLFGAWITYLSGELGYDVDYIHRWMKSKFLARIYATEPKNGEQSAWTELLFIYQERGEQDKLAEHAKRISLKWATVKQMKEYMNQVDNYWLEQGYPLPQLGKNNG